MMAKLRLAFLGFRHGHVMGLYQSAQQHSRVEVVAAIDQDASAAAAANVSHGRYDDLIASSDVDAIAVGEYFGRRGEIIIRALEANKHVISDKPICTRPAELDRIVALAAAKRRSIGCLLDLRDHGPYLTMRRLIRDGAIGKVHTVNFTAQHPLLLGTRAAWYFEEGKHGGTINDIGIHAIDAIPWLTGRTIVEATAARAWNARVPQFPRFQDAAQVMLKLDNGGGVLGDLSYLAPDGVGYSAEQYWRITCHGDVGVIETNYNAKAVTLAVGAEVKTIPADPGRPTGSLDAFLDEIDGKPHEGALTTAAVLDATRRTLLIQQAADENRTNVPLTSG
jgi:predicted dehydrogenase